MLQPEAPGLFGGLVARSPRHWLLGPLFEHLTALMAAQAFWWAAVGISAVELLRLKPWARPAIEGVGWVLLVYATAFGVFWARLWLAAPTPGFSPLPPHGSYRAIALASGLAACAAIAAALAVMIVFLRRAAVRLAFQPRPDGRPAEKSRIGDPAAGD